MRDFGGYGRVWAERPVRRLLVASLGAERFARRRAQRSLILVGFVITIAGVGVLLATVYASQSAWAFAPGLLLIGFGLGTMLTPSVNIVQSSFPEDMQGEISGLSRSVSNLGSCLGTAIAGTILVAGLSQHLAHEPVGALVGQLDDDRAVGEVLRHAALLS